MRKLIPGLLALFALPAVAAPLCTDTEWLNKAYGDLLFRPPTQQEVSSWIDPNTHSLSNGATRFEAAWAIASSNEGTRYLLGLYPHTVSGYYEAVLGRPQTEDEFNTWWSLVDFPQGNAPDFQVLSIIVGGGIGQFQYADEFAAYAVQQNPGLATCSPNRAVVNQVFQVYLGRNATQQELDFWTAQLVGGVPLQSAALGISTTPDLGVGQQTLEYFNRVVRDAFQRFYRRAPGPDELVQWSLALSNGTGLNEELWAMLMQDDQYCSGVVHAFAAQLPPPPTGMVLQLQSDVLPSDQMVFTYGGLEFPYQAANTLGMHTLQQQVVAQDAVIAQLSGNVIPCPPDHVCLPGTTATPAQVIIDLTAQVGALNGQILLQGSTISQQQQLLAQQQATIVSLVDAEFGLPVNLTDATAARSVAADEIAAAALKAATRPAQLAVQHAQMKFAAGDAALREGIADQALRDYKDAFRDASRALQ